MLALVLAMIFCVAIGTGVVGYVMLEARREGRGEFWTAEGEELIAGARRTGEKVRTHGGRLGRTAAERTRDLAARRREVGAGREVQAGPPPAAPTTPAHGAATTSASEAAASTGANGAPGPADPDAGLRAAS